MARHDRRPSIICRHTAARPRAMRRLSPSSGTGAGASVARSRSDARARHRARGRRRALLPHRPNLGGLAVRPQCHRHRGRGHGPRRSGRPPVCGLRALCRALADHYGVPNARVLGHREIAKPAGRKVDPNFDMTAFRAAVASSDAMPTPTPMPTADEIAAAVLARRIRNFHGDTVTLGQIVVATEADHRRARRLPDHHRRSRPPDSSTIKA